MKPVSFHGSNVWFKQCQTWKIHLQGGPTPIITWEYDWIPRGRELLLSLAKETNNRKGRLIEALEHSVQKHSQQPSEENTYKGGPKYQLSCK